MSSYPYPVPCVLGLTIEGDCRALDALVCVVYVYPSYPSLGFIVDTRGLRVRSLAIHFSCNAGDATLQCLFQRKGVGHEQS